MPLADRLIKLSMVLTVIAVAAVGGVVSYSDIHEMVIWFGGEHGLIATIFPVSVDGIVLSASLTLLFCSRYQVKSTRFVRLALWSGISTTFAANCVHGIPYGWPAAVIDTWPALSLIISSELLWWVVGTSRELDTSRAVIVVDKPQGQNADELTKVAEIIANQHDVSSAEIARRLDLPYPKVLKLTKDARRLLNGSHLSVMG